MIELEVFEDFEQLNHLREEWDEFVESVGGEIYLSFDWCRVWWHYYGVGRTPIILIASQKGVIVAILPLFIEEIGIWPFRWRIAKIIGSDFLPVTVSVPIKEEAVQGAMRGFIEELKKQRRWDILYLGAISGKYGLFEKLTEALKDILGHSYSLQTRINDVQTYFEIGKSWDEYFRKLNKHERKRIRRSYSELEKKGIIVKSEFAQEETYSDMFDSFVAMHQAKWRKDGRPGHFGAWPLAYEFQKEVSAAQLRLKRLRLLEIKLGDRCIGYKYAFRFGNTYYAYLDAREEITESEHVSYFRVAFAEQAQWAIREGVDCIDSLRGKYEHKLAMGGKLYPIRSIYIYEKGIRGIKIVMFRIILFGVDLLYLRIWRRRLQVRMGGTRSPFWEFWIRSHMIGY